MDDASPLRRLLHRWFVEYNPLYIFSAALVLGGILVLSRGLAQEGSVHGGLAVVAIAELYALALVGGAALLVRIGHRRAAVMLAVLTALYQMDLTLHTEACPNLGAPGVVASGVWLALFVVKLFALARAMKVRLPRRVLCAAALCAAGLTVFPYVLREMPSRAATALVVVWLGALVTIPRGAGITSELVVDDWSNVVLRRTVIVIWSLGSALLALHVLFWTTEYRLSGSAFVPAALLVATRFLRTEVRTWLVTGAVLSLTALAFPSAFATTAFVAAIVLALRALSVKRERTTTVSVAAPAGPYRAGDGARSVETVVAVDPRPMTARFFVGSALSLYFAIWTIDWAGGPWPAHVLPLDVVAATVVAVAVWRAKAYIAIAPVMVVGVHTAVVMRVIPTPHSFVEWGGVSVALGFLLLFASLAVSFVLRTRSERARAHAHDDGPSAVDHAAELRDEHA